MTSHVGSSDEAPAGRVCVVGSFMMDLTVRAPRRPAPGETVFGTGFDMFLGGKGLNQAIAARRAGAQTAMIGRVGDDDFGRQFLACLDLEGIDASHVTIDPTAGTGIGVPLVEDSGENSIVVVPRANSSITTDDIEAAAQTIRSAQVLLLQLELPLSVAACAARIATAAGVTVVLNPAPARTMADLTELHDLIDVLVPNESEAHALLDPGGSNGATGGRTHAAVTQVLQERLGAAVVMTAGGSGCVVADGADVVAIGAHVVDVVDTVGAGDAFCGVLGAWLADGATLHEAAAHANAAGALAVTQSGAEPSMPYRAQILRLVDAIQPST